MKESLVLVRQEGLKSSLSPLWDWRGFIYSHHAAFSFDFSASVDSKWILLVKQNDR